ncbi:MAG: ABC transporter permease [Gammaproteobacteria bacterium]|nr:ABC transporter permease [Gammaproteobacteria bacterium]
MKYALRVSATLSPPPARHRGALASALLFGPLFGPVLFAVVVGFSVNLGVDESSEPVEIPVVGADRAPNLIAHLGQRLIDVDAQRFENADALRDAVRAGDEKVGLLIDEGFGEALGDGTPARLWLVVDQANASAQVPRQRLRAALGEYGTTIGMQRLQLRGIDPNLARPFAVLTDDVSTPSGRSVLLLGMMTYFLLFAMLLGGFQVAIDTTAGERERGSLEPLLTLPVRRRDLVLGKVATAIVFMAVSLALAVTAFGIAVQFMPLAKIGMATNLSPWVCLLIFTTVVPFAVLGAGLMTFVASFTKSFREAQTYTSIAMTVPPLPVLFSIFNPVQPSLPLMPVPSLSQHLLVTSVIKGHAIEPTHLLVSAVCTIAIGALCTWGAVRRFRSEKLLV